jgi:hypothetical protein
MTEPKSIDSAFIGLGCTNVTVRARTADLLIEFENGSCLEVFNSSSGYEGWGCSDKDGLLVVARGGGEFATWNVAPPLV